MAQKFTFVKKKKKEMEFPLIDLDSDVYTAVEEFNGCMDGLSDTLVARSEEIEALKFAIATKQHIMLEGSHGTAKSMLADCAFRLIDGAKVFEHQFMKGTQADEVFGPMNSKIYRDEARWSYNTEGMLPECHLANLDEIYRGSDMLLPAMFRILNERWFKNGRSHQETPLITAVGTTNFTTNNEELNAFHDRWLIKARVKPLQNSADKLTMLERLLLREVKANKKGDSKRVHLDKIRCIHENLPKVRLSRETISLYEQMVAIYVKSSQAKGVDVSDRRLCLTLKLVQAAHLLSAKDKDQEAGPECLAAAKYGLCVLNNEEQTEAFGSAYERLVGDYLKEKGLADKFSQIEKMALEMEEEYDADMPAKDRKELLISSRRYLKALDNLKPADHPKSAFVRSKLENARNKFSGLVQELTSTEERPVAEVGDDTLDTEQKQD